MQLPKINQRVDVRILVGPWAGSYSTYVSDIDQTSLSVAFPMFGETTVPLPIGEEIAVEYLIRHNDRGIFHTRVLSHAVQGVPVATLQLPSGDQIERVQLRNFVRLEASLPLHFSVLQEKAKGDEQSEKVFLASRTNDISGGGAQILCPEEYPVGTRLEMVLQLDEENLPIIGEVVRAHGRIGPTEIWLGVRFVLIDERTREKIVRYIFSEQRSRRQRGLL